MTSCNSAGSGRKNDRPAGRRAIAPVNRRRMGSGIACVRKSGLQRDGRPFQSWIHTQTADDWCDERLNHSDRGSHKNNSTVVIGKRDSDEVCPGRCKRMRP